MGGDDYEVGDNYYDDYEVGDNYDDDHEVAICRK